MLTVVTHQCICFTLLFKLSVLVVSVSCSRHEFSWEENHWSFHNNCWSTPSTRLVADNCLVQLLLTHTVNISIFLSALFYTVIDRVHFCRMWQAGLAVLIDQRWSNLELLWQGCLGSTIRFCGQPLKHISNGECCPFETRWQ